jgi:hypothetical protein
MGNTYPRQTLTLPLVLFIASHHPLPCHLQLYLDHWRRGGEELGGDIGALRKGGEESEDKGGNQPITSTLYPYIG